MGCGSSSNVAPISDTATADETKRMNDTLANDIMGNEKKELDDVPTVQLPDVPGQRKPPLAFEIPMNDLSENSEPPQPPPRIQQLIEKQTEEPNITLPDIEEKLSEAERRREKFLMQRAASASKRAQKAMKMFSEMDNLKKDLDIIEKIEPKSVNFDSNTMQFTKVTAIKANEDKNI